jgi:sulfite reductase (NADPH) flavoprotein alpha-component
VPPSLAHRPGDSLAIFPENDPKECDADSLHIDLSKPGRKLLLPRFYSIASSSKMHPDEIHLTITRHEYGVSSRYLCQLAQPGVTELRCYVQQSRGFALPGDHNIPIVMIGPGTGIAPFRAFLQERLLHEAAGANWLFFGERNRATDFYYEEFWRSLEGKGKLRLDLAFSRDQAEKKYVQSRLYEAKKELWEWIQRGCHLYVCGDRERMAKDVDLMLQKIIQEEGGFTPEEARLELRTLRREKRYLLDIY